MAPAPSSFGAIAGENGSEWLDNLEAHFLDQEWDTDDAKKCKYFRLKLTGHAKAQYEKLDVGTKNSWEKLSTTWCELHPSLAVVETPETTWIRSFSSLHLDESKLMMSRILANGEETWESIEFAKCLEEVGSKITVNTPLSKGLEAYSNLPTIIRTHLPQFTDGPTLPILCLALCAIDHYFLADAVRERVTLMNRLERLDKLSLNHSPSYSRPLPPSTRSFPPVRFRNNADAAYSNNAAATFSNTFTPASSNNGTSASSDMSPAAHRRYVDAIKVWHTKYGKDVIPGPGLNKYPITPGSASPGSGECWRCGQKGHRRGSPECQQFPPLPETEQHYRASVQASVARAIGNAVQFGADKLRQVAVNLIEANEWETFVHDYVEHPNDLLDAVFENDDLEVGNPLGDGV